MTDSITFAVLELLRLTFFLTALVTVVFTAPSNSKTGKLGNVGCALMTFGSGHLVFLGYSVYAALVINAGCVCLLLAYTLAHWGCSPGVPHWFPSILERVALWIKSRR